jgi:hypothetical protein
MALAFLLSSRTSPPCDDEEFTVLNLQRQGLGDLAGFDSMASRGQRHRGGAAVKLDDLNVRGIAGKEVANRVQTHAVIFPMTLTPFDRGR